MAKTSMNFNASLRLNTKEFQKGVNTIKRSINDLKKSLLSVAGALGAGLGFTQLLSNIKNTAVQLSVAKNMLENVSHETQTYKKGMDKINVTMSTYKDNMAFIRELADTYSQDLIGLTQGFAQFHAACQQTNITLDQQKDIFESLTRAAAYYHMSSERVKDMQNAIIQMIGKGRVQAEELRRQLGNQLPGAVNLFAASLGLSVSEMDDMMRKGKIIAEDALPKFAAMLNTVTQGGNFDSLQLNINRLKNTWYDFVENVKAEGIFDNVVKGSTRVLKNISDNFKDILWTVKNLAIVLGSLKIGNWISAQGVAKAKEYQAQLELIQRTLLSLSKQKIPDNTVASGKKSAITMVSSKSGMEYAKASEDIKEARTIAYQYNQTLLEVDKIGKKLRGKKFGFSKEDIAIIKGYNEELKKAGVFIEEQKAGVRGLRAAWLSVENAARKVWITIKSIASTAIWTVGFTALMNMIDKLRESKKEWKEINSIYRNYLEDVKKADTGVEAQANILMTNYRIIRDTSEKEATRIKALKEINRQMGLTGDNMLKVDFAKEAKALKDVKDGIKGANKVLDDTKKQYDEIYNKVKKWIEATRLQAKIQVQAQKQASAEDEIDELERRNRELNKIYDKEREKKNSGIFNFGAGVRMNQAMSEIVKNQAQIKELRDVARHASAELTRLGTSLYELNEDGGGNGGGDDGKGKPKGIEKIFEDWKEEYAKLRAQLKEGAISKKKYDEELDKLITKTWSDAAGTGKLSVKDILAKQSKGAVLSAMEEWYLMLSKEATEAIFRALDRGTDDVVKKLSQEFKKSLDEEIDNIMDENLDNILERLRDLNELELPELKAPDTWDNYKKKDYEIWEEYADAAEDYVKALEDLSKELKKLGPEGEIALQQLSDSMGNIAENARDLRTKARVEEWKEDIKELKEQFGTDLYNGIKNTAQGLERLYDTFKDLADKFEEAEGFEKVVLAFETLFDVLETGMAIYEGIKKASETLALLKKAEGSEELKNMEKQLAMRSAMAAAATAEAGAVTAAEAAKTSAIHLTAAALKNAGVAGAVANAMQVPYPANLAALAQNMAALTAALSAGQALQAFANGGIVGGNSTSGDKNLIRANSREMVLTTGQQKALWNFIKNGSQGGGNVEFKIKGCDLVGTLNNYNRIRKG